MMKNTDLYNMIFKRKSFHLFRKIGNEKLSVEELNDIYDFFEEIKPLNSDIKVKMVIDKDHNTCKRGQEYSILLFSEKKDNYLQNIGYIGEQLDLYLVSKNIATLWFGIGKVKDIAFDGLDYVIMIAIAKAESVDCFRKDMFKSKRKSISEFWNGDDYLDIASIVRFTPSACNSQPWYIKVENDLISVYRYRTGKRGIMPRDKIDYYNQIDIGIFLLFLELCLDFNKLSYERTIYLEEDKNQEFILNATYKIKEKL